MLHTVAFLILLLVLALFLWWQLCDTLGSPARWLLGKMGYTVSYVHKWGTYTHRYNGLDMQMHRPIHPNMSVAPPSARRRITRTRAAN